MTRIVLRAADVTVEPADFGAVPGFAVGREGIAVVAFPGREDEVVFVGTVDELRDLAARIDSMCDDLAST